MWIDNVRFLKSGTPQCMLTGTHLFQLQENFLRQAAHMKHYWGLNSLTLLRWTSTSGKLCVLWVQRSKHFYSLFQNIDSIPNVLSTSVFVVNRLMLKSLDHTNTHIYTHARARTHTHAHTKTHQHIHTHKTHTHKNTHTLSHTHTLTHTQHTSTVEDDKL
jgi:hypothetical protein